MIVRTLRLERGWSQEQLAQMTGLNIRTIQRIEGGQKAGLESLKALAAVFEVELSELTSQQEPVMSQTPMNPAALESSQINPSSSTATEATPSAYNAKQERAKVFILGARFLMIAVMMFGINLATSPEHLWALWPAVGMGIVFLIRCIDKLIIDALKSQTKTK